MKKDNHNRNRHLDRRERVSPQSQLQTFTLQKGVFKGSIGFVVRQPKNQFSFAMIPQGLLSRDEFELTPVLDMKGIPAGFMLLKLKCSNCGLRVSGLLKL
jgi:hypothetical protein